MTSSNADGAAHFVQARRLFLEGLDCFKARRFVHAERLFLSSLSHVPGRLSTLVNLAATQLELARPQDALRSADQALAVEADKPDAWFHRGRALDALGRHHEAVRSLERALALDDRSAALWLCHGQALQGLNRDEDALDAYARALAIDPGLAQAWSNRGGILRERQRPAEAAHAFEQALAHGGHPELNAYYLAAVGARAVPAAAPRSYVQSLFDDYAGQFDEHLVQVLGYRAPAVLARQLEAQVRGRVRAVLDLGCGTGLCGPVVRPLCDRLTGVDLSERMLDQARRRKVYDDLVRADIVEHLRTTDEHYDAVVAADVFIYVGDLAPVFTAAHARMTAGGAFCFSVEESDGDAHDFELLASLRYAHSERYLRALAAAHGLQVAALSREPVREDQREAIDGLFVCLVKP